MIFIKNFQFNKKNLSLSFYFIFILCSAIAFEKLLGNINIVFDTLDKVFNALRSVLSPFLYGFFIAYLLNPSLKFVEINLFDRVRYFNVRPKLRRLLSALTTFLFFIGITVWIIAYLVPTINKSTQTLIFSIPDIISFIENQYDIYFKDTSTFEEFLYNFNSIFSTNYTLNDLVNFVFEPIKNSLSLIPGMFNIIISTFLNTLLGLMIAFYSLCDKELFTKSSTKFLYTIFRRHTAEKIIFVAKDANNVFEKFFIGKVIDSFIISLIFFFGGMLLKLPYLQLLSLIVGITNMIPYFGPFIGAIPVVIIVFLNNIILSKDPMQFIWTALFIFALQQFDGIILGPKILGDSTGLKPMGVIFAIIVGGATFGVLGMFLGVPVFAVIVTLFKTILNKKYDEKYDLGGK